MLILNFTYPLRCLRVPPVEYHCIRVLKSEFSFSLPEVRGKVSPVLN
jgi:hypothetical protein